MKKHLTWIIMLTLLFAAQAIGASALDALIAKQKQTKTLTASFEQEKHALLLDRPIKSRGKFYYKSGAGVRWQYDDGMIVVYDGQNLYIYNPETKETDKMTGAKEVIGPLNFDLALLAKKYKIETKTADSRTVLTLKAEKQATQTMEMVIPAKGAFPNEVKMLEESGESTVIKFEDIKTNGPLDGKLFIFSPPPGTVVKERPIQ